MNLTKKITAVHMDHEINSHEMRMQLEVMNKKLCANQSKLQIIENELSTYKERIDLKNSEIINMEREMKKKLGIISNLNDEVISWKLHNSRMDDTLLTEEKVRRDKTPGITVDRCSNDRLRAGTTKSTEEDKGKGDNIRGEMKKTTKGTTEREGPSKQTNDRENKSKTPLKNSESKGEKSVIVIGTSNTKFLSRHILTEEKVNIDKVIKYTLKDTNNYIDKEISSTPDAIVLHSFCNDLADKSPEMCVNEMNGVLNTIDTKFPNTQVVVSLGLPRTNQEFNRKAEKANVLLKEEIAKRKNVKF